MFSGGILLRLAFGVDGMRNLILIFLLSVSGPAVSGIVDESIVYIECYDGENNVVSEGSGVIVSENGHVLTARHVFYPKEKDAKQCRGSIGVADRNNTSRLIVPNRPDTGFDAAIAQFSKTDDFVPMRFCEFDDASIRTKIFVSGFPGGTKTGKPSFRSGIISTTYLDPKGIVETDGFSTAGMSGGPVVSEDGNQLIGIVAGALFDIVGEPIYYGITPVSEFANLFQNIEGSGKSCGGAGDDGNEALLAELTALKDELAKARNPFSEISKLAQSHVVAITCTDADGSQSDGTGVIVSEDGHVITADFVAPEGAECAANLGSRVSQKPLRLSQRARSDIGAVILQVSPSEWSQISELVAGKELKYRSVSDVELGSEVAMIGYHRKNEIGLPAFKRGYVSTNFPDSRGLIEAAIESSSGMGGAPIMDADSNILGILIGLEFDPTGLVTFTSVLSSDYLAQEFDAFIKLSE